MDICPTMILWKASGATLTVAGRRKKSQRFVTAKPCEHERKSGGRRGHVACLELAKKHSIDLIEYITSQGIWEILRLTYTKVS